ncbi:hypothetical protein [Halapricum hydrolyticum]|uniref:Uncharacterized protein n=1 Tax=Halapricum hydrolyticum TaxID=2979991 RepID=A0AAE3LES1_9EURY|nr:hypothetical protein [Halapricum hydrolyticum]MCU4726405.1 hypothetical protein [Halapricum hydrolyticum]
MGSALTAVRASVLARAHTGHRSPCRDASGVVGRFLRSRCVLETRADYSRWPLALPTQRAWLVCRWTAPLAPQGALTKARAAL